MIRDAIVRLGYAALRAGVRPPRAKLVHRFSEQAYFRGLLSRMSINCFIDVGASIGAYSEHLRLMGYDEHLLSFEPVPETYRILSGRAEGDPLWQTFNLALGRRSGVQDFNVITSKDTSTGFSSFLQPRFEGTNQASRITQVKVERLDDVLDNVLEGIREPRIFLKMDTQGYDMEVIGGIEKHLSKVVGLQSEISVTPIYDGMPHYTQSLEHYESLGFSLMKLIVVNTTKYDSILEYDCVMARTGELLAPK